MDFLHSFWLGESQLWVTNEGDTSLILPEGSPAQMPALGKADRQNPVKSGLVPRGDPSPFWSFKESLCLQFGSHEVRRWLTLCCRTLSTSQKSSFPSGARGRGRKCSLGLREEAEFKGYRAWSTVLEKGNMSLLLISFQILECESVYKTPKAAQNAITWLSLRK